MKRLSVLSLLFFIIIAGPVFSDVRVDLGLSIPLTVGAVHNGEVTEFGEIGSFLQQHILPFPGFGVSYQFEFSHLNLAAGIRGYTFILETIFWPNLLLELDYQPFFLDVQFGGGAFVIFGLFNSTSTSFVYFPDISAWVSLNEEGSFRLGGGILGMGINENNADVLLYIPYVGMNISL